jgi:hypothetical protein
MVSDVRSGRWITPLLPPGPILPTKESTLRMHTTPTRGQQRREPDVRHPRWLPEGADVLPQGGVHFRVWASKRHRVEVVLEGGLGRRSGASPVAVGLEPEGTGYFSGLVADAAAVTLYRYRLNGEAALYADPASRFQPDGPHGPSQVIDPSVFPRHENRLLDYVRRHGRRFRGGDCGCDGRGPQFPPLATANSGGAQLGVPQSERPFSSAPSLLRAEDGLPRAARLCTS